MPEAGAKLIRVVRARTNNLKNVSVGIPRGKLTVVTGVSGSGKSSLAFDTVYAEGQRRYVQSLSPYARQFLELMPRPDADEIDGLSPSIAIGQKRHSSNPRSIVATATEIADYLRVLFSSCGTPRCPEHGTELIAKPVSEIADAVLKRPEGEKILVMAPVIQDKRGDHARFLEDMQTRGYVRFRIDSKFYEAPFLPELDHLASHTVDVVVDRLRARPESRQRLTESIENALSLSDGRVIIREMEGEAKDEIFSNRYACPICGFTIGKLVPANFSFNNPQGACEKCAGTGTESVFTSESVVTNPDLSLLEGAVYGFDRRSARSHALIARLSEALRFDPDAPWKSLPKDVQEKILKGCPISGIVEKDGEGIFPGLLAMLEARYEKSSSAAITAQMNRYRVERPCPVCSGTRFGATARNVFLGSGDKAPRISDILSMSIEEAGRFFKVFSPQRGEKAVYERLKEEIARRLAFLDDVGLSYLRLERRMDSLSGGEAQRVRLACQVGSGLTGVTYVLDEPSVGLHPADNGKLIATLKNLRDMDNTVIVVEHDKDMIESADFVIDMGPGAGFLGGEIVAQGSPEEIKADPASLTGQYLSGKRTAFIAPQKELADKGCLVLKGARGHNLKHVTAKFPIGAVTVVTGVSGSGKSSLVNDTLFRAASRYFYRSLEEPEPFDAIEGLENFERVIDVDQSPIGRSPRSNPATYTGLFAPIRELFAQTPLAKERGYGAGRFSFNVPGGRCEACQGEGYKKVEMHFLPDMFVPCEVCRATRYKRETLEVLFKGKSIADVLSLTVDEALPIFSNVPVVHRKLKTLADTGLGYIRLGQGANTLSGGEAQRMKLALELSRPEASNTLYVLDEPTTGLHFEDVRMLLEVLSRLRDAGNTIVIVEHNADVILSADHVIDMGPSGGDAGGEIVAQGSLEDIMASPRSATGAYLKALLKKEGRP